MRYDIATLFPESLKAGLEESIIGRGCKNGIISIYYHNIRDFTDDKHRRVDDYPFGGGKGMVMQADPIYRCYSYVCGTIGAKPHVVYMSPRGRVLTQSVCREYTNHENVFILCGHYEGVDQRVIDEIVDEELSIGDYVLTGGELAAMVLVDSVSRLLPGMLSSDECFEEESHYNGLLEYPQYTRPSVWRGKEVPAVLLSGHHKNITDWRYQQSLECTRARRPDLLKGKE